MDGTWYVANEVATAAQFATNAAQFVDQSLFYVVYYIQYTTGNVEAKSLYLPIG